MKVFTDGTDTFVAASIEHVPALWHAQHGATLEQEGMSLDDWWQVDDDKVITICNFHGCGEDDKVRKTAAEWAASEPPGLLCSTEW